MNALQSLFARLLAFRRGRRTLRLVEHLPLFGGTVIHVIDAHERRFIIAASSHAIRILWSGATPHEADERKTGRPANRPQCGVRPACEAAGTGRYESMREQGQ